MGREVEISRIEDIIQGLEYPLGRKSAAGQLADVTLILADGEANQWKLIASSANVEFESADDVIAGLHNTVPREAVGEPYQSDGDS